MELLDWAEFEALATELNFRRAATRIGISQPSLTRRIRHLEQQIGTYLFERYSNGIRVTAAGELFQARAPWLSRELAQFSTDLAGAKEGIRGRLAVNFFPSLSSEICQRVLRDFLRKAVPDSALAS